MNRSNILQPTVSLQITNINGMYRCKVMSYDGLQSHKYLTRFASIYTRLCFEIFEYGQNYTAHCRCNICLNMNNWLGMQSIQTVPYNCSSCQILKITLKRIEDLREQFPCNSFTATHSLPYHTFTHGNTKHLGNTTSSTEKQDYSLQLLQKTPQCTVPSRTV